MIELKTMEEMLLEAIAHVNETNKINFVALAENGTIDDNTALDHMDMFDDWKAGVLYKVGQERKYPPEDPEALLYKCTNEHTSQSDWTPDVAKTLWAVVNKSNAGTIDDPIPAVVGMEYTKGLYYIEDGVTYLMNREGMADGETIVLYYTPSQLVGQYFEIVEV